MYMQVIVQPERKEWDELLKRPYVDNRAVLESVQQILNAVRQHGDEALRSFIKKFDGADPDQLEVDAAEIENAGAALSPELKQSILQAEKNIERFHRAQLDEGRIIETMPGIQCWRRAVGIERVGLYIPGGTAPPDSREW